MKETSIVIRTFNEDEHIGNLLEAIQEQEHNDYEVIIVDSGSTDKTLEIVKQFDTKIIQIESRDFTFGYALNVGCEASSGKYLVFASAHVLPTNKKWLTNLLAPFEDEDVAMTYGRQVGHQVSKFSEKRDFERLFKSSPHNPNVPVNYANNANSAIRKEFWEETPFDEYLFGLEDIEWARCMKEKGYHTHYEPNAAIYHIHNEAWYQVFNRYRREAIAAVRIGLDNPPQAKMNSASLVLNVLIDTVHSLPNVSRNRLEEILRFRYYQWKGSRLGWSQGKNLDLDVERNNLFYPIENKSVIIKGKRKAVFEDTPIPEIKPGDILIKVDYVGVCRTDIEVYEGTLGYYRDGFAEYPIVPGHEFSGTIAKVGSNNRFQERFKVGEKVVGECILSRGEISERKEVGVINQNGAYSQYIVSPGDSVHHIPENLDTKKAALTEPLAVVLRALRRIESRLSKNSTIAVIGAGQIGNLSAQVLSKRGYKVSLYDKDPNRLEVIEGKAIDTNNEIENLDRFDTIIEATGSKQALEKVLKESRVDSTVLLLGFPYGDMEYNFEDFVGKEKVIIGSVGADSEDFHEALKLLSELNMEPFTEVTMPLKDFNKAWDTHKSFKHLKILLQP